MWITLQCSFPNPKMSVSDAPASKRSSAHSPRPKLLQPQPAPPLGAARRANDRNTKDPNTTQHKANRQRKGVDNAVSVMPTGRTACTRKGDGERRSPEPGMHRAAAHPHDRAELKAQTPWPRKGRRRTKTYKGSCSKRQLASPAAAPSRPPAFPTPRMLL